MTTSITLKPTQPNLPAAAVLGVETQEELIKQWLILGTRRKPRPNTVRAYVRDVTGFLRTVAKPLHRVTQADVASWATGIQSKSLSTQRRMIGAVKSLYSYANRGGYLAAHNWLNPTVNLHLPEESSQLAARILPEEDVVGLIVKTEKGRDRALLSLLYAGGLRVSEAVGLRWKDLYPATGEALGKGIAGYSNVKRKGGRTEPVGLPKKTWDLIQSLRGGGLDGDPVFCGYGQRQLTTSGVWRIVRAAAKRAGISKPVSPHWLRHCCASHSLDRGASVALVKEHLGHSTVAVTSRYIHAKPSSSAATYLVGV
jgi:integrase/recombinase XerD